MHLKSPYETLKVSPQHTTKLLHNVFENKCPAAIRCNPLQNNAFEKKRPAAISRNPLQSNGISNRFCMKLFRWPLQGNGFSLNVSSQPLIGKSYSLINNSVRWKYIQRFLVRDLSRMLTVVYLHLQNFEHSTSNSEKREFSKTNLCPVAK